MDYLLKYLEGTFGSTMSPAEVAFVLDQSTGHVRKMCADGTLPAVKIGHRWHIVTASLAALLEKGELR